MNGNIQNMAYLYSNNNFFNINNLPKNQMLKPPLIQANPNISNGVTNNLIVNNSQVNDKNQQDPLLPQNLIKTGLFITSLNIPQQMKDNLIKKVLKSTDFNINLNDPSLFSSTSMNSLIKKTNKDIIAGNGIVNNLKFTNAKTSRVMFTKDEDEKIKLLVKKFGTRHWDLIAHFMERRTAKQCRDRYSNYLIPGYFQGEWSKEEDDLLIRLYKEVGPKWSVLQRYFPNRGANNIKNRWHYFLSKQVQNNTQNGIIVSTQIIPENQTEMKGDEIQTNTIILNDNSNNNPIVQNQNQLNENVQLISQNPENEQEDDNIETKNNNTATTNNTMFEMENEWMMFN